MRSGSPVRVQTCPCVFTPNSPTRYSASILVVRRKLTRTVTVFFPSRRAPAGICIFLKQSSTQKSLMSVLVSATPLMA